jgi:hypothetical protein
MQLTHALTFQKTLQKPHLKKFKTTNIKKKILLLLLLPPNPHILFAATYPNKTTPKHKNNQIPQQHQLPKNPQPAKNQEKTPHKKPCTLFLIRPDS